MTNSTATFQDWIISIDEKSAVTVSKGGVVADNTKAALREIAEKAKFAIDPSWNTQQLGAKLCSHLNPCSGGSKARKAFVFSHYELIRTWKIDYVRLLADIGHESIKDYLKKNGDYSIQCEYSEDDGECYVGKLSEFDVLMGAASDTMRERTRSARDNEWKEYKTGFLNISKPFSIATMIKGLTCYQASDYLIEGWEIPIKAGEDFDIEELRIKSPTLIEYKGKEYESIYYDGDDNGNYIYYLDGKRIN